MTPERLTLLKWSLIITYIAAILGLTIALLISFPGYVDTQGSDAQYNSWYFSLQLYLTSSKIGLWLFVQVVSTVITIYAIQKQY